MYSAHSNTREAVVKALNTVLTRLLWATMLVMAVVFLSGCATAPEFREARDLPPAQLLQECEAPSPIVTTNGDLARYILALKQALNLCNDDKAALREWAQEK